MTALRTVITPALFLCALAACDADVSEGRVESALVDDGWSFVRSDISPATSYSIHDDGIDLNFYGYFTWHGTWASGYRGYTFARAADVVAGGTYQVALTVSNTSNGIPAVVRASLGGAAEQSHTFFGPGTATLSFTVTEPGDAPVLEVTAHPVLGHLGPTEGIGIGVQSYRVTASVAPAP